MNKYLVLYYSPAEAMEKMATASDEEKAEGMKPWEAWREKLGSALVDMGAPLMMGKSLDADGNSGDVSGKVTGYSIVQAENLDAAMSHLEGHPHLAWMPGCSLDVFEMAEM